MFFRFVFLGFFVLFVIGGRLFSSAGIIVLALLVASDEGHGRTRLCARQPRAVFRIMKVW